MRTRLQAYQTGGRPGLRTCKRKGETAQSSTSGRTHRLVTLPAGQRGKGKRLWGCSEMPTIGGWRREQAVCLTTASFWELVKREHQLGLDVDTATSARNAQGWACGREEALGGALARVGDVHVMHPERGEAGPERWGLPIPLCLLRSRNAWKTSLTACVCSIAAMGRDTRNDICVVIYLMQLSGSYLHLHNLVPVAASRF
jgi:hypothetical protein